jgi:hypothetical protein
MNETEIEFGELPAKRGRSTNWSSVLVPFTNKSNRGKWGRVKEFDTPEQAQYAQSNLSGRKVVIPYPDWDWHFASRQCDLWAMCRGPFLRKTKRTTRRK